jgi:hypothetical protein
MVDTKSPASPTIIGDTIDDATKLSLDMFTIDGFFFLICFRQRESPDEQ